MSDALRIAGYVALAYLGLEAIASARFRRAGGFIPRAVSSPPDVLRVAFGGPTQADLDEKGGGSTGLITGLLGGFVS